MKRPHIKEFRQPLPWLTASKKIGSQSYNHKELNSASIKNVISSRFFSCIPSSTADTYDTRSREHSHTMSDYWPTELWANKWVLLSSNSELIQQNLTLELYVYSLILEGWFVHMPIRSCILIILFKCCTSLLLFFDAWP